MIVDVDPTMAALPSDFGLVQSVYRPMSTSDNEMQQARDNFYSNLNNL